MHYGGLLLALGFLFILSYLLGHVLARVRIPNMISALLIGMLAYNTPLGRYIQNSPVYGSFTFVSYLGILFLLFYIGLQIDLKKAKEYQSDIIWLTVLNTSIPFLLGLIVMLSLGYNWTLALVIGVTCMPTAEAVVTPILDEFRILHTKIGQYIIAAGTIDDVIEVFLIAAVSMAIGGKMAGLAGMDQLTTLLVGLIVFTLLFWISHQWLLPRLIRMLSPQPLNLMMLTALVLFCFGGVAQLSGLGLVVGAICAGILMRPAFQQLNQTGIELTDSIRSISYGFLGPIFFFWIGLNADLAGVINEPKLTILLFLAASIGKLAGVLLMVPMKKLNLKEAFTVGIGLDARLTTEIIVAQLLLRAGVIDLHLFTSLVAAASLSTLAIPLFFTFILDRWGKNFLEETAPAAK